MCTFIDEYILNPLAFINYDLHQQMNVNKEQATCGAWQTNLKTEHIYTKIFIWSAQLISDNT